MTRDRQINKSKMIVVQTIARDPSIQVLCSSLSPAVSVMVGENQLQLCFIRRETMFQSCSKKDLRQPPLQFHNMQNMILMFLCCRWCRVSASQSSANCFHTCLYHIINESTRRKKAVASDRHAAQHWRKKKEKCSTFSSLDLISHRIRVWLSPWILFSRLCVCDPSNISVTLWKHQGLLFVFTPHFSSITFCHYHNHSLYWRICPIWHHNFTWVNWWKSSPWVKGNL